ncbi:MAG TPA: DUF488 family protein [Terriglobales bacterium]
MTVRLKRVYDPASLQDGARVLVDRLWPRGLTKEAAAVNLWLKDVAPSNELRKWFHAHPPQWSRFREKYLAELTTGEAHAALQQLHDLAGKRRGLTLLFASKNIEQNNALVLKQLIDGDRKPPTGTGPARGVAAGRARAAARK